MGGGGGGKSYKPEKYVPPPLPAEPAPSPVVETMQREEQSEVSAASDRAKKAAALAKGRQETVLTGSLGDTSSAQVYKKTLLGQ